MRPQQLERGAGDVRARPRIAPRQRVDLALDRAAQQPVPARVELDLVDPVAVAVVGEQPRLVALGAAAVLLRLGRAGDHAGVAHAVDRPARRPRAPAPRAAPRRAASRSTSSNGTDWLRTSWVIVDDERHGAPDGGQDEGLQAGDERVGARVAAGERADAAPRPARRRSPRRRGRRRTARARRVRRRRAARARTGRRRRGGRRAARPPPPGRPARRSARRRARGSASARRTNVSTQAASRSAGRQRAVTDLDERVDLALRRAPEDLREQVALGREVAVDACRSPRRRGARPPTTEADGVAALGELVQRGVDDPLAGGGGTGARALGRAVRHRNE